MNNSQGISPEQLGQISFTKIGQLVIQAEILAQQCRALETENRQLREQLLTKEQGGE
jgi:hypothetical protein